MLTCRMRFISLLLLGMCTCVSSCKHPWSVCEVFLVPYVVGACDVVCVECEYAERVRG